jgi:hypothetical protein
MRGIPKILNTKTDIENLARDLPVLQAAAFVQSIPEDTWERLQFTPEERAAVEDGTTARLGVEDKDTQRRQARVQSIIAQIALRSEVDGFARDARRLKEEINDLTAQIADHRAEGFEEALLKETIGSREQLLSLFGSILTKHSQWMGKIVKLRKKMKDEEV